MTIRRVLGIVALLFCNPAALFSQAFIEGKTSNEKTGEPIPFVNVYLSSNLRTGTATNIEGDFSIKIFKEKPDTINFSHIGFKKRSIPINALSIGKPLEVDMVEKEKILDEVIVMPHDSLISLLSRAFFKIKDNYPQGGSLITGFYRETNHLLPEGKLLYFSESVIQFFKPSYSTKQYGPAKIIEGGKSELYDRHKYSPVNFYAGPYVPQRFDFVKERVEFIDPDYFSYYDFKISGLLKDGDTEILIIKFSPKEKGNFEGEFYLDKKTLAYVEANFSLSENGIVEENRKMFNGFEYNSRRFNTKYNDLDNRWQIFLVVQDGIGQTKKSLTKVRYINEYLSTSFEPVEVNPIKETEAIPYSDIYTQQEEKFTNDFWEKSEILRRTHELDDAIKDKLFADVERSGGGDDKNDVASDQKGTARTEQILSKCSYSFSIGIVPVQTNGGLYYVNYDNHFSAQNNFSDRGILPSFGYELKYFPVSSISISAGFLTVVDPQIDFSFFSAGIGWSKRIAGWKRPLFVQPAISFYHNAIKHSFGEVGSNESFVMGNTNIDASKINPSIGEVKYGLNLSAQLSYKFYSQFSIFLGVSAAPFSSKDDFLFVKEKSGSYLSRKTGKTKLDTEELIITNNGIAESKSSIQLATYSLMANIGIRIGFK